jgi:tetratricopeptide (TPR) repeat protein
MDFPELETPEEILEFSSIQLFLQSAKRARVDFEVDEKELVHLSRICRLVEGIPLGIIFATSWVDILSLEEIAEEIQNSIDFLDSQAADLPDRQRSMRAAFNYSWNLLSDEEREAFARMSVFRGGCTRVAAQQVTGASLRMLTRLANKSFLNRDSESGRFHIHGLLRQLGEEHLEASGQEISVQGAHSTYYLNFLAKFDADLKGRDQLGALNSIEKDFENVRAAWHWAVHQKDFENLISAIGNLYKYCKMRTRYIEGEELFKTAQEVVGINEHSVGGRIICYYEELLRLRTNENSQESIERALQAARELDDKAGEALSLYCLAQLKSYQYDYQEAIYLLEEALKYHKVAGDTFSQAEVLHLIGFCYNNINDIEGSKKFIARALEFRRACGDQIGAADSLNNLAYIASDIEGEFELARTYHHEAYTIQQTLGNRRGIAWSAASIANLVDADSNPKETQQMALESLSIADEINVTQVLTFVLRVVGKAFFLTENYHQALEYLERLKGMRFSQPARGFHAWDTICLAHIGLDDFETAHQHQIASLEWANYSTVFKKFALKTQALFLADKNQIERATELAALYYCFAGLPPEMDPQPLFKKLITKLRDDLPDGIFNAAWARGEGLDVDEEYQKEFGDILESAD